MQWSDISPKDAVGIELPWTAPDGTVVEGPMNEVGERCPWPWDPQQLAGAPIGQYHCPYCGGMQMAGVPHLEYTPRDIAEMAAADGSWEPPFLNDVGGDSVAE